MIVCDPCPYKGRCEHQQRCIQGINAMPDMTPAPAPAKVVQTSKGMIETAGKRGAPIKGASKGEKKKARKVTMQ